ncbi:MAG: VOC family protein [Myxococcota bacterium]|nr:VOC family protein [Myxococcota bacterium]
MPIERIDHLAITVEDMDATLAFYKRVLDAQTHYEAEFRKGEIPVVILQVGASRISVHVAVSPASPHAACPQPGSADICFRWTGTIQSAQARLRQEEVEIIEGPVPRPAADGKAGQSVYFRDPDGNLLELLTTD